MFKNIDKQFWETVIDTMQEGLMLIAPNGKVIFVNKAFEKLMGYSSKEIIGRTCDIFRCDRCFQARTNGLDAYYALFKDQKVRISECIFRTKNGTSIHLLKNAIVIRDKDGEIVGGIEILIDLSSVVAKKNEIAILA